MSEERKINGINEFLQMSMTNNMPLSVNEKRQIFDLIIDLQKQLQQKENIIKEVREEVRIYEEQSNDGTTNELDNYVFVQRLKKVLDKEVN